MRDNMIPAGFWIRAAAFLLDNIIVGVVGILIQLSLRMFGFYMVIENTTILFRFTPIDIIAYLLSASYFIFLTARTGSTLGKKAMGICVVGAENGEKADFGSIIYRETVGRYLTGIAGIGYLYMAANHKKLGFHDLFSNTCVIYMHSAIHRIYETEGFHEGGQNETENDDQKNMP